MAKIVEKGVLLTFDEIRILLFVCGIDRIEGIYMPQKEYTAEDIIDVLHHLTKRGYIFVKGEAFAIQDEICEILETIGKPESTFIQRMPDGQAYFCYVSADRIVVGERYWKKENTLKLRMFGTAEFYAWREEMENDHYRGAGADVKQAL